MSRSSTTNRTLEPWPADTRHGFVPDHQHAGFTDPNIGRACGELALPVLAPPESCRRSVHEGIASMQLPDVNAWIGLYEVITGHAGKVTIVQTEAANH